MSSSSFRALLLRANKTSSSSSSAAFVSLERSPFLKWSAQSRAFESGRWTHVVHPNVPVFEKKRDDDDDDDENEDESNPALVPPRCVNVGKEEKKAFGRAKHVQTLSASMFTTSDAQNRFKRQLEMVAFGCEDVSHVLFVSGDGKRNAKKDLDALEMLKIAKKMRMKGSVPDHVKFAVVANPNTEDVSAEYLEQKVDAGAELVITQPFFDHERCHEWVENAKMRGLLSVPSSSSQFSNSDNSSASLVIGACSPANRKDVEFWAKLVYGEDQFVDILSSTSSPIAKLAREYEQKENEMTTALYRDWIFERCELSAVSALGHPASAGVHFMPVTRIGYDIVKHLARRTREMETMEENA